MLFSSFYQYLYNLPLRTRMKQTKKEQDILASAVTGLEHMLPMVRGRQSSDKKKLFFSPQQKTTRHTVLLSLFSPPFFKVLENLVNSSCSRHQTLVFSLNRINFQPTLTLKASLDKLDRILTRSNVSKLCRRRNLVKGMYQNKTKLLMMRDISIECNRTVDLFICLM